MEDDYKMLSNELQKLSNIEKIRLIYKIYKVPELSDKVEFNIESVSKSAIDLLQHIQRNEVPIPEDLANDNDDFEIAFLTMTIPNIYNIVLEYERVYNSEQEFKKEHLQSHHAEISQLSVMMDDKDVKNAFTYIVNYLEPNQNNLGLSEDDFFHIGHSVLTLILKDFILNSDTTEKRLEREFTLEIAKTRFAELKYVKT